MWKRALQLKRYSDRDIKNQNDTLVIEKEVSLILNKKEINKFQTIPLRETELAIGYLISNQIIHSLSSISSIKHDQNIIEVEAVPQASANKNLTINNSKTIIHRLSVFQLTAYFQEKALLFKDAAITNSAAIATPKKILHFSEDLSRLNAIDKAFGLAIQSKENFSDKILLTSGKVDHKVVQKSLTLGIPVIISRTAPTDKALDLANKNNQTIIGFARGRRFNLYTGKINQ
jgi:FdhD protein